MGTRRGGRAGPPRRNTGRRARVSCSPGCSSRRCDRRMAHVHHHVRRVLRHPRRYRRHPCGGTTCLVWWPRLDRHPSVCAERSCSGENDLEAGPHSPLAGDLARRDTRRDRFVRSMAKRSHAACATCRADGAGFVRRARHPRDSSTPGPIDRWLHSAVQAGGRNDSCRLSSCVATGLGTRAVEARRQRCRRGLCRLVLRSESPWSSVSARLWGNAGRLSFGVRRLRRSISFQT